MYEIPFLTGELVFAGVWILIRAAVWIIRRRIDWKREAQLLLLYADLAVIIRFTFFPLERIGGRIQPLLFDPDKILPFNMNLHPFQNMVFETREKTLINLIGNLTMLIPTGFLLPLLYRKLDRLWKVVLTGALLSISIELLQLLFYTRTTDVNDLILNTLGVAAGYGFFKWYKRFHPST